MIALCLGMAAMACAAEPRVEVLSEDVGAALLVPPATPSERGAFLVGEGGLLRWVGKKRSLQLGLAEPLLGRPVAGCGLSKTSLAVLLAGDEGTRLVVLAGQLDGEFSIEQSLEQSLEFSPADQGDAWSLAADGQRLFVASGRAIYRGRHTSVGVAKPKPFAKLKAPVRSLALSGKGYLVALTGEQGDEPAVVFLDPTGRSTTPLARFALPLREAGRITYSSSAALPEWLLYAATADEIYRIDSTPGSDGLPVAKPTLVHRVDQPVRGLIGIESTRRASEGDEGVLMLLSGGRLLYLTPQSLD